MYEIETKILEIDADKIIEKMDELGADKVLDTRYVVDWYKPVDSDAQTNGWYLRIRRRSDGTAEITWKGESEKLGVSRKHKEIHITVQEVEKFHELFLGIGMETYAHQEKDRISWTYKDWRFDMDTYPNMPTYIEIEGQSEEHIQEAISLLDVVGYTASSEGERVLFEGRYNTNWHDMRF